MHYVLFKMYGSAAKRVLEDGTEIYGYIRGKDFAYKKNGKVSIITMPDDGSMDGFRLVTNDTD